MPGPKSPDGPQQCLFGGLPDRPDRRAGSLLTALLVNRCCAAARHLEHFEIVEFIRDIRLKRNIGMIFALTIECDALAHRLHTEQPIAHPEMRPQRLPGEARIERQPRFTRQSRPPVAAIFQAEVSALQRMNLVVPEGEEEPEHHDHDFARVHSAGNRAAHHCFHVLRRVKCAPRFPVSLFPFRRRHFRVLNNPMVEVVFVHVRVHPHALLVKRLVVLRTGQRCQEEELKDIDRQFSFDDLDVALDRFLGVVRKAENIAGIGDDTVPFPGLKHGPIVRDPVLPLLRAEQTIGIDVFEADKDARDACALRLLDEAWDLMAERIHLDDELDLDSLLLAQRDQAIEERFPIAIAREIVVREEKALDALGVVFPDDGFEVVGRAGAALASLNVDNGAERALVGAPPPQIHTRRYAYRSSHRLQRQDRHGLFGHVRQIGHEIVERLQGPFECVRENDVEAAILSLACEKADTEVLRRLKIGGKFG